MKRRLPEERPGLIHQVAIGGQQVYFRTGEFVNSNGERTLGEIFITIDKEGGTLRVYDALGIAISIGLQHGIPIEDFINKFRYLGFEPNGVTSNPKIPLVKSIVDYLARWLQQTYSKQNQNENQPEEDTE